jgi:hypothetical protein
MAGRSKACSIDGLRKQSVACGLGRIEVASAEAVVIIRIEKRVALLEFRVYYWRGSYIERARFGAISHRMRESVGKFQKSVLVLKSDCAK